ncbi:hypothetical protein DWB68_06225 [Galactobacter valiniphilus]|uniref:Glycosyltransferase RgtA/B/C/D-like domain-containing protein n=1 Tax=Galactobacter valiniphilus TaxID=2676122 RepID=A0A399JBW8_9MICC|nr:hypothetical protein DWB68_06225 [Galactobacter valiniphilus]
MARDTAMALARGEQPNVYEYFSNYPNNISLVALDRIFVALSGWLHVPFDVVVVGFNAIMLGVLSMSASRLARAAGGKGAGLLAQLFVLLFLATSPWMAVSYTDVPVAAFLTAGLALALVPRTPAWTVRVWIRWILAAVLIGLAAALKPTAWIVVIALVLAGVLAALMRASASGPRASVRPLASALAIAAMAGLVGAGLPQTALRVSELDADRIVAERAFPMAHWMRMGMTQKQLQTAHGTVTMYGGYDVVAVAQMRALATPQERNERSLAAAKEELRELGVLGTARFLVAKTVWTWSDGSFGVWTEGRDASAPLKHHSAPARLIQEISSPSGAAYRTHNEAVTGAWFVILLSAAWALWIRARTLWPTVVLTLVGVGLFLVMFEARARYLVIILPLVLVLGAVGLFTEKPKEAGLSEPALD